MTTRQVWGIAAILLALASWGGCVAVALSSMGSAATWTSPGAQQVQLDTGRWTVFEFLPADSTAITPGQAESSRTISTEQVTVTDPQGNPVQVSCAYCTQSEPKVLPVDLRMANAIVNFHAMAAGQYTITITAPAGSSETVGVSNPMGQLEDQMIWLTLLSTLGFVLIGSGVGLLIAGRSRQPRAPRNPGPPPPPTAPPPGWYQNPYQPNSDSQMWWDGTKWTSNWR